MLQDIRYALRTLLRPIVHRVGVLSLGADRRVVMLMILREAVRIGAVGLVIGLPGAVAAGRVIGRSSRIEPLVALRTL